MQCRWVGSLISFAWHGACCSLQEIDTACLSKGLGWQGALLDAVGPGHAAASDSHGHRERQQTRQLRKDLTLLFSIINEQQSKQIRTERGWGVPECCWRAEECTRPRHQMVHTHRPSTLWLCRAYLSTLQTQMCFSVNSWDKNILFSYCGFSRSLIRGWSD